MADLAIKGPPTRGEEIIQLLEMLGGMNKFEDISFITPYIFLFVDDDYYTEIGWDFIGDDNNYEEFVIYTLEEFEEKYPYKVGDVVDYYVGMLLKKETHTIIGMQWDSNKCRIQYHIDNGDVLDARDILYSVECKIEQSKPKRIKDMDLKNYGTATIKYIQENGSRDMELIIPYNQEIVNIDGRYILRDKKPQYPKTYEECCKIVDYHLEGATIIGYKKPLLENLQQLLTCRDAYWKIAGEEMGLDEPWKYNMSKNEFSCAISYEYGSIQKCEVRYRNHFLVFPTAEMRDAFYENFKDLINEVKELL